jgi:hypothetical protein
VLQQGIDPAARLGMGIRGSAAARPVAGPPNVSIGGIVQAQESVSDYYVVGYYTSNTARNGHFRRVKISLNQDTTAKLDYRQGYYADKEFSHFTTVDKERQLEDALMLEDPITDLSIAMEIDHFQLNRAEYFVPIIVKIPGRELALASGEITEVPCGCLT